MFSHLGHVDRVQHLIETRELDLVTVSGKTEPVRIYELMSRIGELREEQNELREVFADGLVAYRQREWDKAEGQFEKCLRAAPDDGPSHLFLERIALFRSAPPQADWDGSGAIPKNDLRAGSEPATWPPAQIDTMSMMARAIAHSGARTPRNSSYSLISRPQGARP